MKHGVVILTAILPTEGHRNLIEFAHRFMKQNYGRLTVLLFSRYKEPISGLTRIGWFQEEFDRDFQSNSLYFYNVLDDEAPQNPGDHPDFWNWWSDRIKKALSSRGQPDRVDYFFASENYGVEMSKALGCQFIPYDIARDILPISGTQVRHSMPILWDKIIKPARHDLSLRHGTFCMFGQESVGKTTIAKAVAQRITGAVFEPEWARPYLETVGVELNEEKMDNIFRGQYDQMMVTAGMAPITLRDTDLLSTIGYQRLKGWNVPNWWEHNFYETQSTLYFLLPDDVPFEEDPLRYGGDRRETNTAYWEDLLQEFGCNYMKVPTGSLDKKINFVFENILVNFMKSYHSIRTFKRD